MTLYIAFWTFDLSCLGNGPFTKAPISAAEATALIGEARQQGTLRYITDHDLHAPHSQSKLAKYHDMCDVLEQQWQMGISYQDFDVAAVLGYRRLQLAPGEKALVISSNFINEKEQRNFETGDLGFRVSPESVRFSLVSAVAP